MPLWRNPKKTHQIKLNHPKKVKISSETQNVDRTIISLLLILSLYRFYCYLGNNFIYFRNCEHVVFIHTQILFSLDPTIDWLILAACQRACDDFETKKGIANIYLDIFLKVFMGFAQTVLWYQIFLSRSIFWGGILVLFFWWGRDLSPLQGRQSRYSKLHRQSRFNYRIFLFKFEIHILHIQSPYNLKALRKRLHQRGDIHQLLGKKKGWKKRLAGIKNCEFKELKNIQKEQRCLITAARYSNNNKHSFFKEKQLS